MPLIATVIRKRRWAQENLLVVCKAVAPTVGAILSGRGGQSHRAARNRLAFGSLPSHEGIACLGRDILPADLSGQSAARRGAPAVGQGLAAMVAAQIDPRPGGAV